MTNRAAGHLDTLMAVLLTNVCGCCLWPHTCHVCLKSVIGGLGVGGLLIENRVGLACRCVVASYTPPGVNGSTPMSRAVIAAWKAWSPIAEV